LPSNNGFKIEFTAYEGEMMKDGALMSFTLYVVYRIFSIDVSN